MNALHRTSTALALAALALAGASPGRAQQAPDAGRLLEERKPPAAPSRRSDAPVLREEPIRPAMRAQAGTRFHVARIRFSGNTVLDEAELQPLVADVVGAARTLGELEAAAERVTARYRERGYFVARAYVPAQDVKAGEVEIVVREGRLGEVEVHGAQRIPAARLEAYIAAALPADSTVLREEPIERALLLINDLPGVQAQATLLPGTRQATTTLRLDVAEGPRLGGSIGYDNHGNRFTGRHRPSATLELNSPAGIGDQLRLAYSGLAASPYLGVGYSTPVGASGLRASASVARTLYRLCCEFAPLEARGSATVAGVQLSYPIVRSRRSNLHVELGLDRRAFENSTVAGTTSDKTSTVLIAGLSHEGRDDRLGGGVNFAGASLVGGRLDLDGFGPRPRGRRAHRPPARQLPQAAAAPLAPAGAAGGLRAVRRADGAARVEEPRFLREVLARRPGRRSALLPGQPRRPATPACCSTWSCAEPRRAPVQGFVFVDHGRVQLNHETLIVEPFLGQGDNPACATATTYPAPASAWPMPGRTTSRCAPWWPHAWQQPGARRRRPRQRRPRQPRALLAAGAEALLNGRIPMLHQPTCASPLLMALLGAAGWLPAAAQNLQACPPAAWCAAERRRS